ncbi:MAG: hypothetical protein AAF495_15770 [Pseudomonadota bacterium]
MERRLTTIRALDVVGYSGLMAAYVNLTSVLGELGRLEEAREVLFQEPGFTIRAYTAGLVYRNPADVVKIAEGLRRAGLPG